MIGKPMIHSIVVKTSASGCIIPIERLRKDADSELHFVFFFAISTSADSISSSWLFDTFRPCLS